MNPKGNVQQVTQARYSTAFPVSVSNILHINGKKNSLEFLSFILLDHNFMVCY